MFNLLKSNMYYDYYQQDLVIHLLFRLNILFISMSWQVSKKNTHINWYSWLVYWVRPKVPKICQLFYNKNGKKTSVKFV